MQPCLFCSGDASTPDHWAHCDGRQGGVEAAIEDMPRLISGLTADTWETSEAAADSVRATMARQRALVLEAIVEAGRTGRSDDEVQALLNLAGHSECPRRLELWRLGRITVLRDADGRAIRRVTRTGRTAVVWIDARLVLAHREGETV